VQEELFVARAPGRLDVMGGIADYSGSLVLQLPLAEACHVAVQRRRGDAGAPTLRVVSFNDGAASRAPAYEAPLAQLVGRGGNAQPFSSETSVTWCATLLWRGAAGQQKR
jgi:L-arabinokinase